MRLLSILFAAALPGLMPLVATAAENVTDFTLDNGMQVVVIEDHRAPVVTHMVWYRSGSADEPLGQSGVAHFLEHLLFKATDTLAFSLMCSTSTTFRMPSKRPSITAFSQ